MTREPTQHLGLRANEQRHARVIVRQRPQRLERVHLAVALQSGTEQRDVVSPRP